MRLALLALASACLVVGCQSSDSSGGPSTPSPTGNSAVAAATFAEVQPILVRNCGGCHGAQPKEGYDLRTHESMMKGGDDGPLVKPGDAKGSLLVQVLRGQEGHKQMPPGGPLPDADIQKVEAWITAGAKS